MRQKWGTITGCNWCRSQPIGFTSSKAHLDDSQHQRVLFPLDQGENRDDELSYVAESGVDKAGKGWILRLEAQLLRDVAQALCKRADRKERKREDHTVTPLRVHGDHGQNGEGHENVQL